MLLNINMQDKINYCIQKHGKSIKKKNVIQKHGEFRF